MQRATVGLICSAGLLMAAAWWSSVSAQDPVHFSRTAASGQLIALSCDAGNGPQQVIVIDPLSRVLAVYHIERASGRAALKSVRRIHWDLQMEEFNGVSPLPREIQSLIGRR